MLISKNALKEQYYSKRLTRYLGPRANVTCKINYHGSLSHSSLIQPIRVVYLVSLLPYYAPHQSPNMLLLHTSLPNPQPQKLPTTSRLKTRPLTKTQRIHYFWTLISSQAPSLHLPIFKSVSGSWNILPVIVHSPTPKPFPTPHKANFSVSLHNLA